MYSGLKWRVIKRLQSEDASCVRTKLSERSIRLIDRFNVIFETKLSSSALIIGSERKLFITKALQSSKLSSSRVAYVNGSTCTSDSHAMLSIAESFLLRPPSERNSNIVLEDLESYLRVRYIIHSPHIMNTY